MLEWLKRLLRWVPFRRAGMQDDGGSGSKRISGGYPIRLNLLIVAFLIAALNGGIIFLTYIAITNSSGSDNQFVIGALIGLLPTGITGLVGLGTTLLNESRN